MKLSNRNLAACELPQGVRWRRLFPMAFWLAKEQVNPMEPYYTIVFRKSAGQWVALCLENGLVGQGATKEKAAARLHEATASFEEGVQDQQNVYRSPISVKELHEFLVFDEAQPVASYELRAVYA